MTNIGKTLVPFCVMRIKLTLFTVAVQDTGYVHLHDNDSYVKLAEKREHFSNLINPK
jgi:hypothetical protein